MTEVKLRLYSGKQKKKMLEKGIKIVQFDMPMTIASIRMLAFLDIDDRKILNEFIAKNKDFDIILRATK